MGTRKGREGRREAAVTKTKSYENEDLRPGLSFRTTKTKTPGLNFSTTKTTTL